MRRLAARHLVAGLVLVLSAVSCGGDGPAGPGPTVAGVLEVTLVGARPDDRAVLVVAGPGVVSVEPLRGDLELHVLPVDSTQVLAVLGPLAGGALFRASVSDVEHPPAFTLRDVAGADGELRENLEAYGLQVSVH